MFIYIYIYTRTNEMFVGRFGFVDCCSDVRLCSARELRGVGATHAAAAPPKVSAFCGVLTHTPTHAHVHASHTTYASSTVEASRYWPSRPPTAP